MDLTASEKLAVDNQCYKCVLWSDQDGCIYGKTSIGKGCGDRPIKDCGLNQQEKAAARAELGDIKDCQSCRAKIEAETIRKLGYPPDTTKEMLIEAEKKMTAFNEQETLKECWERIRHLEILSPGGLDGIKGVYLLEETLIGDEIKQEWLGDNKTEDCMFSDEDPAWQRYD